ncbi:unknown [Bacteroides sp. CAG:633]|jgi:hypothetical protein|uniref:hypothetical protein n=1 Tax=Bacteroides sp. CAG:633 TaxID=1262744 RepID=UPI00033D49B4|nr:hypothetical protein [Bacteroides sp. CAG:633]CDB10706.1 unknown [Bacteroides sp. CAG:633]
MNRTDGASVIPLPGYLKTAYHVTGTQETPVGMEEGNGQIEKRETYGCYIKYSTFLVDIWERSLIFAT